MWRTFWAALELAESRRARLTLAKTCDGGRAYVWVAPFAVGGAYLPPELESPEQAARELARVVEQVPSSVPVTTIVLGADAPVSLLRLLRSGNYGAVVADRQLLGRCWRVRRQLRRDGLLTVATGADPVVSSAEVAEPVEPIGEARRLHHIGIRPRYRRRLAGAGD